jgi:hypothetical protein
MSPDLFEMEDRRRALATSGSRLSISELTLTAQRWFLSVYYPKAVTYFANISQRGPVKYGHRLIPGSIGVLESLDNFLPIEQADLNRLHRGSLPLGVRRVLAYLGVSGRSIAAGSGRHKGALPGSSAAARSAASRSRAGGSSSIGSFGQRGSSAAQICGKTSIESNGQGGRNRLRTRRRPWTWERSGIGAIAPGQGD